MSKQASQIGDEHRSIFNSIAQWVRDYRASLETSRAFAQCGPEEVAAIAQDLMISPHDLAQLAQKGPESAQLLHRMLAALGIDEDALVKRDPAVMRDLERLCATCGHKRHCAHDLAAGAGAEHYRNYCPNAYTLGMLSADKKTAPARG